MFIEMRTDRSFDVTRIFKAKAQDNFVEDWVEASPFSQHFSGMFDADNNNPIPNTQEWGHHTHWASNNPAFHTDQKRALYSEGAITPQRPYYWQLMNHCPQQEAITPTPGVESWPYSGSMLPPASSNSPICSRRNADSFRQNVHNWPRPPHLLFPGGPFPLSEGGPPSLPPSILYPRQPERSNRILSRYWESTPPYCAAQTLRQRPGVDTPPRFSTSTNAIYPQTTIQHNDSSTTPFSTLPYYTASTYGMQSTSLRNQSNVQLGAQNPDSMNYTDHGCYSLPVTTTACDHQYKTNQRSRPLNVSSTPLAKQSGPIIQNASGAVKQGLHRRALSDPGPCSLEDSNVMPSNPPPPPPPLRIDNWMKGRQRNSRLGVEPSVIQDNQWGEQNDDRKVHRMEPSKEISVIRGNESSETESEMSGIQMKPLKASGNAQAPNKSGCCCSCWSSQKKLLEEMLALKEANRKICREMKEMRKEIDDLRMVLPSPALGKQSNGFLGWQYQGLEYNPGMISELVEEVREAAQVREEAFLAHIHSSIMSQGSNCGCGQAMLQDGSVDELNRKKANCWWWNRSQWGKTSTNSCIPLNSKSIPSPKNKISSDTTELENLKEIMQEVQDEKKQTDVRLKTLEEELNKYKLSNEILAMRRISHQENESSMDERGDRKSSKDNSSRQGFDACRTEEPVNQEIVLLRNEVQKLRIQLQNTLTTKDSIVQDQKIEQLTALLQRLMCPANGISLSGSGSYPAPTCSPQNLQEVSEKPEDGDETRFARKPSVNEASVEKLIQSMSFAKNDGGEDEERENSSPPNSLESNCSSSSSSSPLNFSSCHPPVTIHGPVTDL